RRVRCDWQSPSMFDSTKGALLVAPSLSNSSCWLNGKGWPTTFPAPADILKAFFILALSMSIVFGNLVLICVLNNRRYIKYIDNQALLRGAVSQQSAVILGCVLVISITWILSVSLFAIMVLPRSGYYFNSAGLMACDVFHSRVAFRLVPPSLDFIVTWLALSNSFWNPFLYWLLNSHFRRISNELLHYYVSTFVS
ncbi:Uncharacterized protein OBRU01_22401, partial [Operophtera brumata]